MGLRRHFTEHPASVDESYFEHFKVATHFAKELMGAAMCCAIHAVVPSMHTSTASAKVRALCDEMSAGKRGQLAGVADISELPAASVSAGA